MRFFSSFPTGYHDHLALGRAGPSRFSRLCLVPPAARTGHMYAVGKTGKGKSKFLQTCLFQDIAAKRACGVIDPHSDLIADLVELLASQGILADTTIRERIIYLDPASQAYVIPFNVLAVNERPYVIAQNVIEAFRRTWSEALSVAPNFENNMLYALLVLIKAKRTLIDLPRLWTNGDFRHRLLMEASDPELTSFFEDRFAQWGREAILRIESLLNKATALTMNPHLRLMLGQATNNLNFRQILDEGKILLADLGHCDEESQRLIGNLITTGIEQAVFSRHNLPPAERRPFYLYIDEFQDFSAGTGSVKTFAKILSGARKMGLHLTIAHQNLSQLSERLKGAVIGNVWTKVIFGISEDDAYEFARIVGLGNIDPSAIKHDATTDMQHPLYLPLPEQYLQLATVLANQAPRQAVVRDHEGKTQSIWTLPLPKSDSFFDEEFYQSSMARWGMPYNQAKRNIDHLFSTPESQSYIPPAYEPTAA